MVTIENYHEKLEEFKKLSKNKHLILMLERKQCPEKLRYELEKYSHPVELIRKPKPIEKPKLVEQLKILPAQPVIEPVKASEKLKVIRNKREVFYDDLPKRLQLLWDYNRDDYKEIRSLHEKLKLMETASNEDRGHLTMKLVALDEEIHKRWKEIDSWVPVPDELKIDHKRISANRKAISVGIAKLESGSGDSRKIIADLQARFDEMQVNDVGLSDKIIDQLKKWGINTNATNDISSIS